MAVVLNGRTYDLNTHFIGADGFAYAQNYPGTSTPTFPDLIFADMLAQLASAYGVAPGGVGGYLRSNGAAWVRVTDLTPGADNAGALGLVASRWASLHVMAATIYTGLTFAAGGIAAPAAGIAVSGGPLGVPNGAVRAGFQDLAVSSGGTKTLDLAAGNQFTLAVSTASAFTVAFSNEPNYPQRVTIVVVNNSGGAMGAITWPARVRLAPAFVNPANGKARTLDLMGDVTHDYFELGRAQADL